MKDDANRHTPVQRYVDILTDAGFKAVFGDERNKDVLIDLVNVVLPENRHVMDLTYATTEIPGFTLSNKSIRIDLRCTGDDGSVFIVELQCYHQHNSTGVTGKYGGTGSCRSIPSVKKQAMMSWMTLFFLSSWS